MTMKVRIEVHLNTKSNEVNCHENFVTLNITITETLSTPTFFVTKISLY